MQAIGSWPGFCLRVGAKRWFAGAESLGVQAMSMLQDPECDRQMQIESIVGIVREFGRGRHRRAVA
jgi:hypothetical protein